jgi:hypothetical protein
MLILGMVVDFVSMPQSWHIAMVLGVCENFFSPCHKVDFLLLRRLIYRVVCVNHRFFSKMVQCSINSTCCKVEIGVLMQITMNIYFFHTHDALSHGVVQEGSYIEKKSGSFYAKVIKS